MGGPYNPSVRCDCARFELEYTKLIAEGALWNGGPIPLSAPPVRANLLNDGSGLVLSCIYCLKILVTATTLRCYAPNDDDVVVG